MIKTNANLSELISYSKGGIVSKELVRTEKRNITLFCMSARTELSEHTTTKEATVLVLEGKGTFILEGEKIEMLPNVLISMKKNAKHSLKAEENTSFILSLFN